jgi:hypothetical protein
METMAAKKTKKREAGRPPVYGATRKRAVMARFSDAEMAKLQARAEAEETSVSELVYQIVCAALS